MSTVTINGVEYTPFESGKNAEELGIDLSRKFIVVAASGGDAYFVNGDIISIDKDDNSYCPYFKNSDRDNLLMYWSELAYYDEPKAKSATPISSSTKSLSNTIITSIKDEAQHKRVQEKLFRMGLKEGGCHGDVFQYHGSDTIWKISYDGTFQQYGQYAEDPEYKHITADEFLGEEDYLITENGNERFVKIKSLNINNTPTDTHKPIAKGNKIMSNIVSFFNDLTVSAEDKELRKAGLKDGELNWTNAAKQVVLNLEAKDRGYKSIDELASKVGDSSFGALELDTLFTKFSSKLLETAKKFNKREEKK